MENENALVKIENSRTSFKRSDSIAALATALSKAQGEMKGAIKDSSNPFFKSTYADLASVWDACRVPLNKYALAVVQCPRSNSEGVEVETMLIHSSGEWISETLSIPISKRDAQSLGSAITYARRYALASFVGIAPEDDDGNAASRSETNGKASHQNASNSPQDELQGNPFGPGVSEVVEKGKNQFKRAFDHEIKTKVAQLEEVILLPCFTDAERDTIYKQIPKLKTLESADKVLSRAMDAAKKRAKEQAREDKEAELGKQLEISQEESQC